MTHISKITVKITVKISTVLKNSFTNILSATAAKLGMRNFKTSNDTSIHHMHLKWEEHGKGLSDQ